MQLGHHRRELGAFSDVLIAILAYAILVRVHIGPFAAQTDSGIGLWYVALFPVIVALWWGLSVMVRRDLPYRLGGTAHEVLETVSINAAGAVVLLALSLLAKEMAVSRLVVAGFPILSCLLNVSFRLLLRAWLAARRRNGWDVRHVLVVGPVDKLAELQPALTRPDAGLRPVGLLLPIGAALDARAPLPVLGDYAQLPEVLHSRVVDHVAVTTAVDDPSFRHIVQTALREGKTLWIMLDSFGARLMGQRGGGQVVVLSPPTDTVGLAFKRLMDIVVAAGALVLASPFLLAAALAILLQDGAPVIFRQRRIGLHGREFTCLKFRTMVRDAEARRQALLARNEMTGPVFKMKGDPRVTPVGRILRKFSIDELPQLWNVLRGDMSLVGPRPPLPDEVRQYGEPDFRRRLAFRPGLTCLWQVSGRNALSFEEWMALDLRYVDNWSLWLDLAILLRTIPTVLFGSGM